MKRYRILILLTALLIAAIILVIYPLTSGPRVRLKVLSHQPHVRVRFINDSSCSKDFFYFLEVQTNGTWQDAKIPSVDARLLNHVDRHSYWNIDVGPAPTNAIAWRCSVSYVQGYDFWYWRFSEHLPNSIRGYLRRRFPDLKTISIELGPEVITQKN